MNCDNCSQKMILKSTGYYKCYNCFPLRFGREFTREKVRIRDNHTCQKCGKKWEEDQRRFDIHHLSGDCGRFSLGYDKTENLDNLITLCHKCHLNLEEVKEKRLNKSSPRLKKYKVYQREWAKTNKSRLA